MGGVRSVTDDFRIRSAVPLFKDLLARGADVVACTHFGRPNGRVVEEDCVAPIRRRLDELCPGITLLENLRFSPGEETNDPFFGASLVEGIDYYINEAFGASHRAHASIMIPPTLVPSAAGPNLLTEVSTIHDLLDSPKRPFVAIVGGAKIADKLGVMNVLIERADTVIVGGGMSYTFQVARGRSIGSSLFNAKYVDECRVLMESGRVLLPTDTRGLPVGAPFGLEGGPDEIVDFGASIPDGFEALDIGPDTVQRFADAISGAESILWNGPMGVFEDSRFSLGTESVARSVAASHALSVVGGGDSVAALRSYGLEDQVTFVSTGGGASLELVELGDLPGLRALRESKWN